MGVILRSNASVVHLTTRVGSRLRPLVRWIIKFQEAYSQTLDSGNSIVYYIDQIPKQSMLISFNR